jgi:hypothetical protein
MADLVIVAANVLPVTGASFAQNEAGENIVAGDLLYQKSTDRKMYKAKAATKAEADTKGMAVCTAVTGQRVTFQTDGDVNVGDILEIDEVYGISDNAGKLRPTTDNDSADFQTPFAYAKTTSVLSLMINALGTQAGA